MLSGVGVQAATNVIFGERYRGFTGEVIERALGLWGAEEPASMAAVGHDAPAAENQSGRP